MKYLKGKARQLQYDVILLARRPYELHSSVGIRILALACLPDGSVEDASNAQHDVQSSQQQDQLDDAERCQSWYE